jgi:hypothetical protein
MKYLFQRIVPNEFGWKRPSPGRLKDVRSKTNYLDFTGFGHEDWNFNTELSIEGFVYGYLYYDPPQPEDRYHIAFATYEPDAGWFLAGLYLDAQFVPDGAPRSDKVLAQKASDLKLLDEAHSLGHGYAGSTVRQLRAKLGDDLWVYRWRVRKKNVVALPSAVELPKSVLTPSVYRYGRPEFISEGAFASIRRFAVSRAANNASFPEDEADEGDDPDGKTYFEGGQRASSHRRYERNAQLVKPRNVAFGGVMAKFSARFVNSISRKLTVELVQDLLKRITSCQFIG